MRRGNAAGLTLARQGCAASLWRALLRDVQGHGHNLELWHQTKLPTYQSVAQNLKQMIPQTCYFEQVG